jgi:hypothetical protein
MVTPEVLQAAIRGSNPNHNSDIAEKKLQVLREDCADARAQIIKLSTDLRHEESHAVPRQAAENVAARAQLVKIMTDHKAEFARFLRQCDTFVNRMAKRPITEQQILDKDKEIVNQRNLLRKKDRDFDDAKEEWRLKLAKADATAQVLAEIRTDDPARNRAPKRERSRERSRDRSRRSDPDLGPSSKRHSADRSRPAPAPAPAPHKSGGLGVGTGASLSQNAQETIGNFFANKDTYTVSADPNSMVYRAPTEGLDDSNTDAIATPATPVTGWADPRVAASQQKSRHDKAQAEVAAAVTAPGAKEAARLNALAHNKKQQTLISGHRPNDTLQTIPALPPLPPRHPTSLVAWVWARERH